MLKVKILFILELITGQICNAILNKDKQYSNFLYYYKDNMNQSVLNLYKKHFNSIILHLQFES